MKHTPEIYGILVTYRRAGLLAETLPRILDQTRPPDVIFVVDNESSAEVEQVVRDCGERASRTRLVYCGLAENTGSAGGWAHGMKLALERAHDDDWLLPLDDDDPPEDRRDIERVAELAERLRKENPVLAAVGIVGARFCWRSGFIQRIPDAELHNHVAADWLGSGHVPLYSVAAVRDVGVFGEQLFFGLTEVEYGLRLKRAGYEIFAHGEMFYERRQRHGRLDLQAAPTRTCHVHWKKYYVIRNHIALMRQYRRYDLALKQTLIHCLLKPAATLFVSPGRALAGCWQGCRAAFDGWTGRLGRRVTPRVTSQQQVPPGSSETTPVGT